MSGNPVNLSDPLGLAPVCNRTNHPIVVMGGVGGPLGDGHGKGGYPIQIVLPPGECVSDKEPESTGCGDDKLKDVDAVDFNGDGTAERPRGNRDYLPPPFGNFEKIPGDGSGIGPFPLGYELYDNDSGGLKASPFIYK